MTTQILLALVASLFTATSAVAQRVAAAPAPGEISFSWRLLTYLLRRPVWFLGILCMIAGFLFQLAALHVGELSLVQPVIATELLFVFAFLAVRHRHGVRLREWAAAVGMAAGLGLFLFLADPSGGSTTQATAWHWILAAVATAVAAGLAVVAAVVPMAGRPPTPTRKAAFLAISAGIAWGFVAAVIKELSVHVGQGPYAVFTNWSPYVLIISGAVAMYLVTNAFQAGPLAASQPGLTIVDPLVASALGLTLFGEHLRYGTGFLIGEILAVCLLVASVVLLSRSPLVQAGAPGIPEGQEVPAVRVPASEPAPAPESEPAPAPAEQPAGSSARRSPGAGHAGTAAATGAPAARAVGAGPSSGGCADTGPAGAGSPRGRG